MKAAIPTLLVTTKARAKSCAHRLSAMPMDSSSPSPVLGDNLVLPECPNQVALDRTDGGCRPLFLFLVVWTAW